MPTENLEPLDLVEWAQGGECLAGEEEEYGTARRFDQDKPVDYAVARNLSQMINEVHRRFDLMQLDRPSFAFGLGTGDTTPGAIAALADNGIEEMNFFGRPVVSGSNAGLGFLLRYLRSEGGWNPPIDPDTGEPEERATFTVEIDDIGDEEEPNHVWRWKKNDEAGWHFGGGIQNTAVGVSEGLLIKFRMEALEVEETQSSGYDHVIAEDFVDGTYWTVRADRFIRRQPDAIAYVLVCQLMNALEDVAEGNPSVTWDFGRGTEEARLNWVWPGEVEGTFIQYRGKACCYDHDCLRTAGFHEYINALGGGATHDKGMVGMDGAIQQVRRMINDLRWAQASAVFATTSGITIFGGAPMKTDLSQLLFYYEPNPPNPAPPSPSYGGPVPGNWTLVDRGVNLVYPFSGPPVFGSAPINRTMQCLAGDKISVFKVPILPSGFDFYYRRRWEFSCFKSILKIFNGTGAPATLGLELTRSVLSTAQDTDEALVTEYGGVYADHDGFLAAHYFGGAAAVDISDLVAGEELIPASGGEVEIALPVGATYVAYVGWFAPTTLATASWRNDTDVPLLNETNADSGVYVRRGFPRYHYVLEVV